MRVRRVWINGNLVAGPADAETLTDGRSDRGGRAELDVGADGSGREWSLQLPADALVPVDRIVAVTVETEDGRTRRGRAQISTAVGRVQLTATEGLTDLARPLR